MIATIKEPNSTKKKECYKSLKEDMVKLVDSNSELFQLVTEFSKACDIMITGVDHKKIDPDEFDLLASFIGSLESRNMEKHYLLGIEMSNKFKEET